MCCTVYVYMVAWFMFICRIICVAHSMPDLNRGFCVSEIILRDVGAGFVVRICYDAGFLCRC